jgi:hypothetical protein
MAGKRVEFSRVLVPLDVPLLLLTPASLGEIGSRAASA